MKWLMMTIFIIPMVLEEAYNSRCERKSVPEISETIGSGVGQALLGMLGRLCNITNDNVMMIWWSGDKITHQVELDPVCELKENNYNNKILI